MHDVWGISRNNRVIDIVLEGNHWKNGRGFIIEELNVSVAQPRELMH